MSNVVPGAGSKDTDAMTKAQLKEYHREICDFFLEHGWRDTLSHFGLSPKQASPITEKVRAKKEKMEAQAKADRKAARAAKKASKSTESAKAPKKAAPSESDGEPKPKRKYTKRAKKPSGSGGTRRSKKQKQLPVGATDGDVLNYLLNWRANSGKPEGSYITLDDVIVALVHQVRAAE